MPDITPLQSQAPWVEFQANDSDWQNAVPAVLGTLLTHVHLIRAFEETVVGLAMEGLVHGPAHSSVGQEGGAAGSLALLRTTDQINGSHRGHHQFLSKALAHLHPNGISPIFQLRRQRTLWLDSN